MIAYCQQQKDYRTFKADRIVSFKVLDQQFDAKHISLQEYIDMQDESWKDQQRFFNIEIAFNNKFIQFAERRKYYFGFIEQTAKGDAIHMKFLNSSIEIIGRWLLQFGNQASVIAPPELKDLLKTLADQLNEHYN